MLTFHPSRRAGIRRIPAWLAVPVLLPLAACPATAAGGLPSAATADGAWTGRMRIPNAQEAQAGIYDAPRARLLEFGGWTGKHALNTLWALSFKGTPRWKALQASGAAPPARYAHTMVYDSARDRVLVFGGSSDGNALDRLNDVWALDLAGAPAWTQLTPAGTPPTGRLGHMAIYDPVGDRMIVFGGYDGAFENDAWQLSLSGTPTWSPLGATGAPPLNRDYGTVVYDPVPNRMLLFGGNVWPGTGSAQPGNDLWALTLGASPAWTPVGTAGFPPLPRLLHAAFYDSARQRMVVMGGTNSVLWYNDTWALDLSGTPTWSNLSPAGPLPGVRSDHTFVYDAASDRGILFAGRAPTPFYNDVWTLSFTGAGSTWARVDAGPSRRLLHKSVHDRSRSTYIEFGGTDSPAWRNDLGPLPLGPTPAWDPLPAGSGQCVTACRRSPGGDRRALASVVSDVSGRLAVDDPVPEGGRFGYRLGIVTPGEGRSSRTSAW